MCRRTSIQSRCRRLPIANSLARTNKNTPFTSYNNKDSVDLSVSQKILQNLTSHVQKLSQDNEYNLTLTNGKLVVPHKMAFLSQPHLQAICPKSWRLKTSLSLFSQKFNLSLKSVPYNASLINGNWVYWAFEKKEYWKLLGGWSPLVSSPSSVAIRYGRSQKAVSTQKQKNTPHWLQQNPSFRRSSDRSE